MPGVFCSPTISTPLNRSEYRGTKVAVKRVVPPRKNKASSGDVEGGKVPSEGPRTGDGTDSKGLPTEPVRRGASELAARMSTADFESPTRSTQSLRKRLEKKFIDEIKGTYSMSVSIQPVLPKSLLLNPSFPDLVLSRLRHPNVTQLMG